MNDLQGGKRSLYSLDFVPLRIEKFLRNLPPPADFFLSPSFLSDSLHLSVVRSFRLRLRRSLLLHVLLHPRNSVSDPQAFVTTEDQTTIFLPLAGLATRPVSPLSHKACLDPPGRYSEKVSVARSPLPHAFAL